MFRGVLKSSEVILRSPNTSGVYKCVRYRVSGRLGMRVLVGRETQSIGFFEMTGDCKDHSKRSGLLFTTRVRTLGVYRRMRLRFL